MSTIYKKKFVISNKAIFWQNVEIMLNWHRGILTESDDITNFLRLFWFFFLKNKWNLKFSWPKNYF